MFQRILVPVDFSNCSLAALEYALDLREALGAKLDVAHAYDVPTFIPPHVAVLMGGVDAPLSVHAEQHANEQLDTFLARVGPRASDINERFILLGPPAISILELVEDSDIDLIITGTHGRTGISRVVMGSVAERLLRGARCPVLTVRERASSD